MNIQYYGHSCFKITTKPAGRATEDVVIFIDPFDRSIGLRPPQGQASVVFISHDHTDHNNASALKGDPIIINTPGEYSIRGINAVGINTAHDTKEGADRGRNTVFILESEDINICHLGDIGINLTSEQLEKINGIDILMVPVGGGCTIDGKTASDIVRKIEPKIVIPMHYKTKGVTMDINTEKKFCDEIGSCPKDKTPRINIKKKDIEGRSEEVIIMSIE